VPITQHLAGSTEVIPAESEARNEAPPGSHADEELSDLDLEEVLGGLERIHFPNPSDLPESPT
jgi:hypothetical protein